MFWGQSLHQFDRLEDVESWVADSMQRTWDKRNRKLSYLEHSFVLLQSLYSPNEVFFVLNLSGNGGRSCVASRGFQLHLQCIPKKLRPGLPWASTGLKPVFRNFKRIEFCVFMAVSPGFVIEQRGMHEEHLGALVHYFSLLFQWFCRSFGRRLEISRRCKETQVFRVHLCWPRFLGQPSTYIPTCLQTYLPTATPTHTCTHVRSCVEHIQQRCWCRLFSLYNDYNKHTVSVSYDCM